MVICTLTSRLPAFQSTIQTSESLDKGRLCPPICWLHPALLLPPILPFSPSCCTSSASLFSFAGPCPRIAQQVLAENRAGDVGRVKLSFFILLCISLSVFFARTESFFCFRNYLQNKKSFYIEHETCKIKVNALN